MTTSIRLGDDDEMESADFVVCVPAEVKTPFSDNIFAFCCRCDRKVQHRPDVPVAPKKICFECALPDMAKEVVVADLEVVTTPSQMAEVLKHIRSDN